MSTETLELDDNLDMDLPPMLDPGDRPTRPMPAEPAHLRAAVLGAGVGSNVDRDAGVIYSAILAQEGPFRDIPEPRGEFNEKSLRMIVKQANAKAAGLKMRFGHPSASDDSPGKAMGRAKNARMSTVAVERNGKLVELKCARADIHLYEAARKSLAKECDLVLGLAEEAPDALMLSLRIVPEEEYRLNKDGSPTKDNQGNVLPPLWFPKQLTGVDFVEEGAATDSLLAPEQWAQALSVGLTPELAQVLNFDNAVRLGSQVIDKVFAGQERDVVESRLTAFLERYLTRRYGLKPPPVTATPVEADSSAAAKQAALERQVRLDKLKR